jgi:TRAP-type C4-dicarboxylate transport system permease small subunit
MKAVKQVIDWLLASFCAIILAIVAGAVIWQVVTRYLLGVPSTSTAEVARLLFMWMALLGGAYTFGQGRHLAIDILPQALRGRWKLAIEITILGIVATFAALVMILGGTGLVLRTLKTGQITPTLNLPMGWVYSAIPVAGAAIMFYCLFFMVAWIRGNDPWSSQHSDTDTSG